MAAKKKFYVVYDYGTGGIWMTIFAESREQIEALSTSFGISETAPSWAKEHPEILNSTYQYDIDDPVPDWLKMYIAAANRDG
jgi:hypothetical protein